MPIRRRPIRRRRRVLRRRRFPKKNYSRMGKRFDNQFGRVFNFRRTVDVANIATNTNLSFKGFAYSFKLSDVPSFSEFSNLFNEIRLMGVALTFYPISNISTAIGTAFSQFQSSIQYLTLLMILFPLLLILSISILM